MLLNNAGCAALDVGRQADLVFVCQLCALHTLLNRVCPPVVALVLVTLVHMPVAVAALVVAGVWSVQVHSMRATALLLLVLLQVPRAAAAAAGV